MLAHRVRLSGGRRTQFITCVSFRLGIYPDWRNRDPRNAVENAKEAMDLAERWLGIPQLIQPHEMINPKVDEQSMMTYLSQYPKAKLKSGAPIKPKTNSARVRCYGKGKRDRQKHVHGTMDSF